MSQNGGNKLAIFDHDDGLDISISDEFVQKAKILFFVVKIIADIEQLFFTKIDDSWGDEILSVS